MKTLQNNFTTPEQSKRLLELGLPADSADMLWDGCIDANDGWVFEDFPIYTDKPFSYYQLLYRQEDVAHILPCWSVGRLMEIFATCFDPDFIHFDTYADGINFLQQMMDKFEVYTENMDFSKLEE